MSDPEHGGLVRLPDDLSPQVLDANGLHIVEVWVPADLLAELLGQEEAGGEQGTELSTGD